MLVLPSHVHFLLDRQQIYQYLVSCQQVSLEKDCTPIFSLSLEIPPIDPLAVLHALSHQEQLYFYFEKGEKQEAIAAVGAAVNFTAVGAGRFDLARDFIRTWQNRTLASGALHLPFSGPHFFCSFTFFADSPIEETGFPPATVFLPHWQVARKKNSCVLVANFAIAPDTQIEKLSQTIWHTLQKIIQLDEFNGLDGRERKEKNYKITDFNESDRFKNSVGSALESIQSDRYRKIVLARATDVLSPTPFKVVESLENLRKIHPDCYIFATGNGKGKNFIGASPERLVNIHNQILATDALAGSAPRGKTANEDVKLAERLKSSEKERREHQLVSDFIVQRLSRLGLIPQRSQPARLLQLSNIQHLWTPIIAPVPADISLLEIVAELHPTPAVAGDPREIACQEIRRYESFDRSLYAAPLGWIDRKGNGEFIVGIRSATIQGARARLYAGAGIVAGSDPDKELAEIHLKLQALLKALV